MFWYTFLPSCTACTIVPKSSSCSTMSDASLATSVPAMPMAIPMSARESAGASLSPSPVIATTWLLACSCLTMRSFCLGVTRENIATSLTRSRSSSSDIRSSSRADRNSESSSMIPISLPIAIAVICWSPVIIFTCIPAL